MLVEVKTDETGEELLTSVRTYALTIPIALTSKLYIGSEEKEYELNLTIIYEDSIEGEDDNHKEVKHFEFDKEFNPRNVPWPTNLAVLEGTLTVILIDLNADKEVDVNLEQTADVVDEIIEKVKEFLEDEEIYYKN